MNAAVALVQSRAGAGKVDIARLRQHLEQLVPLPAGFGWEDEPLALPSDDAGLATLGFYADELANAQTLDYFRQSGRASLLLFNPAEFQRLLDDLPPSEVAPEGSWLEAKLFPDGQWVVYPQDDSTDLRLLAWLPVAEQAGVTRVVALDTGVDVSTGTMEAPSTRPSECDNGFSGHGETLKQVCIGGTCTGACDEHWKYIRGDFVLVSCPCR